MQLVSVAENAGLNFQQRRCVLASNKYLINCLVLVQLDFEINKVMNSIIIVRVRCGVAIEWGCLAILGSH